MFLPDKILLPAMLQKGKRYNKKNQQPLPLAHQVRHKKPKPQHKTEQLYTSQDSFFKYDKLFAAGANDRRGIRRLSSLSTNKSVALIKRDGVPFGYMLDVAVAVGWARAATGRFGGRIYTVYEIGASR